MTISILLGYEVGTGEPVYLNLHHLACFGMTQKSGKTTALEALITRANLKAVAFITKRGEGGFNKTHTITPYYKPRSDWQYVEGLVNVALGEKIKYEPGMRYAIMQVCEGRKDLKQIQDRARELAEGSKREFMKSVYEKLVAYLEIVIPELEKYTFADHLTLTEGINVMDLSTMRLETQHLVIASTIEYAFSALDHVIVIIPEAWETIPQSKMTPVKWVAQQFIRKGAAIGNYLWLDSQDIGGIDKEPLRQVDNWLMGRMKEAHEVERILKQLLGAKISAEEIQTLPLGTFYAAIGNIVKKVYALPAGVPESIGVEVAIGKRSAESVRDEFLIKKIDGDDEMYKEENEKLKAEIRFVNTKMSKLKQQQETESTETAVKFQSMADKNLAYQQQLEEKQKIIEKQEHEIAASKKLREALAEFSSRPIPAGNILQSNGVKEIVVSQEIPNITLKVLRPIVEADEKGWRGRLISLVANGYFDEAKRLTPIREKLQQEYGTIPNNALISNELVLLVTMRILQRQQDSGQWVYSIFPGAKNRVKTVEVAN